MSENYNCLKLENQLCFPLYAAARKVTSAYTPYLKPLGITYTQYIVLMVLWENDDVPVGSICRKLFLDSGTLTPLLKKMEENGWLTRTRSKEDERSVMIRLTDKGTALKEKCVGIPSQVGKCVSLKPEDAAQLYRFLYQILTEESE